VDRMSFSFAGKKIAAACVTLASIQAANSPQAFAAAFAMKGGAAGVKKGAVTKAATMSSAATKVGTKKAAGKTAKAVKLSKSDKESVDLMTQHARAAIATIQHSDSTSAMGRLGQFNEETIPFLIGAERNIVAVPTATLIVTVSKASERKAILAHLRKKFGMKVLEEGSQGKVLVRAGEDGLQGIERIQECLSSYPRGFDAISPNFFRVREHRRIDAQVSSAQAAGLAPQLPWNLKNGGSPGVAGADVKAVGAWAISQGDPQIRVAVLDEGVDVNHPALRAAIVLSNDFCGGNTNSSPDGNDAHGTACAGIIASRDANYPGLAPSISLVGARIARSDPINPSQWLFDDFNTAEAIDWCWDDAKADVLSNSWGGGPPSDAIRLAFERARTSGRGGKGCVIVIAAGNSQTAIPFPGTLPNMLIVGASNQWDKRKTKSSQDGEDWWGSCFGPTMGLVAPGVKIKTTDISGASGYTNTDFVDTFNGTSSATPHVAAAAGLVLSVNSSLTEKEVRKILTSTCDPIAGTTDEVGAGRLNVEAALIKAKSTLPAPSAASSTKKTGKKASVTTKATTKTTAAKGSAMKPKKKAAKSSAPLANKRQAVRK
jgi:thermitase